MGTYLNPDNESFQSAVRSEIYIDKTGLLRRLNALLGTEQNCIALSHARRFGKTQAAGMIAAYYSAGCDSKDIFSQFEIAKAPDFEKHLNKYNVIHIDITSFSNNFTGDVAARIWKFVYPELKAAIPALLNKNAPHAAVLRDAYEKTGRRFVIIIDEWDCVIRNRFKDPDIVRSYMQFLHSLFKSEESGRFLALGYITGILPIKKIQNGSVLNNFRECTMLSSCEFTTYYGFTEEEVRGLCVRYGMDFKAVKDWYNGYLISGMCMYNPYSIVMSMIEKRLVPYWKDTASFEGINDFITYNYDGLKKSILLIIGNERVPVETTHFCNDIHEIK